MNDINFNFNECVKSISNIGSTTYQNICNNATQTVPWGMNDWLNIIILLGFILGFVWFIRWMIREY